jgi:hypothetical protein
MKTFRLLMCGAIVSKYSNNLFVAQFQQNFSGNLFRDAKLHFIFNQTIDHLFMVRVRLHVNTIDPRIYVAFIFKTHIHLDITSMSTVSSMNVKITHEVGDTDQSFTVDISVEQILEQLRQPFPCSRKCLT